MKFKRNQGEGSKAAPAAEKGLLRRVADALMFWRRTRARAPKPDLAVQLSDMWRPSEVLERDLEQRRARIANSMLEEAEAKLEPKPDKRRMRRMRREARRLAKAADKMTRLAIRGKIPLENILPLAFPELEKWKLACPPKTQGLAPYTHVEVPDETLQELVEGLGKMVEFTDSWSHQLERLCQAVGAAALFLEQGGSDEDAMTILSGNCGPALVEAMEFAKVLRLVAPKHRRFELARFANRTAKSQAWREWQHSQIRLDREDLLAHGLAGAISLAAGKTKEKAEG